MARFSTESAEVCACIAALKELPAEVITEMYDHVTNGEQGHPDAEFAQFGLETVLPDADFVDCLAAEYDARTRLTPFTP